MSLFATISHRPFRSQPEASVCPSSRPRSRQLFRLSPDAHFRFCFVIISSGAVARPIAASDALERVRRNGRLVYGSDMEGGGPYGYPDPQLAAGVTGFEVELMDRLAKDLGVASEFSQGQWDKLLQLLDAGRIDVVCNGYEWTDTASSRLPGDAAVLRLPAATDGAARQPDPVVG